MRLKTLKLRNWCQHLDREVEFHPQMNVVLGPNGSGKSNLMNAIVFALTGTTGRSPGKKDANVAQLAPGSDSAAFVDLVLEHGGMRFQIRRMLAGRGKTTLKITADEPAAGDPTICDVTGDRQVSRELENHLGVGAELLERYVFIAQGAMFAPFDPNIEPAAHMVAFQRLFGVERVEALWQLLGERLLTLPTIEVPDTAAAQAAEISAHADATRLYEELQTYEDVRCWSPETDPATAMLQQAALAAEAAAKLPAAASTRRHATTAAWVARGALRAAALRHAAVQADCLLLCEPARVAQVRQAARTACASALAARAVHERNIAAYTAQLSQLVMPPLPQESEQAATDAWQRAMAAAQQAATARDNLNAARANPYCRACGQALQNIPTSQDVDAAAATAAAAENTARLAREHMGAVSSAWAQYRQVDAARRQLTESLQSAQRAYASVTVPPDAHGDPAADAAVIAQDSAARAALDVAMQQLRMCERDYFGARIRATPAREQYRQLVRTQRDAPRPEIVAAARAEYDRKRARQLHAVALAASYDAARAALAAAAERRRCVIELAARAAAANATRTRLSVVRDLLHRDVLGRAVLYEYMAAMLTSTNATLAAFGVDFRLHQPADVIDYVAEFADGRRQPIGRLSGGQKVLAALAFMISVNTTFAAQIGLFCPDEPTEWLDADNQACIETAVARLRAAAAERQLQTIMVTHAPIGHLFDNVIRL